MPDETQSLPPSSASQFTDHLLKDVRSSASFAGPAPTRRPGKPRTIACMVTHGMGQQVPFETVSSIAEAFVAGRKPASVETNRVQLTQDAKLLSRIELVYPATTAGQPDIHLHLYEGYWAPLTEGQITFLQTISFLLNAAAQGIRSSLKGKFTRWIFGDLQTLPVKNGTTPLLLGILFVLLTILAILWGAQIELRKIYQAVDNVFAPGFFAGLRQALPASPHAWGHFFLIAVLVLCCAVYIKALHYAIMEFIGDVAIYVTSYKVSAFQDVRDRIQATVFEVGSQIFQALTTVPPPPGQKESQEAPPQGAPTNFLYDEVIFVGHSLGSVITYDLINALIVWDTNRFGGISHNVVKRINRLITFGSPLDKTAFLFRTQTSSKHHYREMLAALQQPIVLSYELRPFPWINLFSHADIVSGNLAYYDLPANDPIPAGYHRVQNLPDPAAKIPIVAHTQYWTGPLLRKTLVDCLDDL